MPRLSKALLMLVVAGIALILLKPRLGAQAPGQVSQGPAVEARPLPIDRGAAGVWQTLRKLHTRASLLMVTAHPDDEDGGMLTYESRGQGARVILLTLNRGEGGANVMSPDYFNALGLVRTQELLAAGRYYGVEQYWTRVIDYGFSKTKEEALAKWDHDRVLYDAVRVVRLTRPLVITSVFVGGPTDGHGNHQVAGQMAQEVFKAAGDPSVFPDQIRSGLRPWSPVKVYARVPFFLEPGNISPKGVYDYATHHYAPAGVHNYVLKRWEPGPVSASVEIPEGDYDPLVGESYLQASREGLGLQRSQNGGTSIPEAGQDLSAYHRFGSKVPSGDKEKSFFEGVDTSLLGVASLAGSGEASFLKEGLRKINTLVEQAMGDFRAEQPEKIASTLASGLKATNTLIEEVSKSGLSDEAKYDVNHELKVKQAQFNDALMQALGISLTATVAPEHEPSGPFARFMGTPPSFLVAVPGQTFFVKVHVANQGSVPVEIERISLASAEGENWTVEAEGNAGGSLVNDQTKDLRFRITVPENAAYTRPYFTRPNIEQPYYTLDDPRQLNQSLPPYSLSAWVHFRCGDAELETGRVVQTVESVTGSGTVLEPLLVGPAISVSISPHAGIVPLDSKSFGVTGVIHSNVKGPAKGAVRLDTPEGWTVVPASAEFSLAKDGEDQTVAFEVHPARLEQKHYTLTAVAQYNGHEYKEGYRTVGYAGLRPFNLYRPATLGTTGVEVKVAPGLNVGYVMGSGDEVPQALASLGITAHMLSSADLASGDLSKFGVILLGVRTYAVRDDLRTHNGRLLDYVKNGGVVIVQYNTPEYDHNYGPYPYTMSNDPEEVSDEESKMNILVPSNPVFNWPNKISGQDFRGWVEERGSKFLQSWDSHYEALLETHDAGQDPQKGGLLYAHYGKGVYIYNAYAFYRQLPEGVPGAYRLFANLVSLPQNPSR